MSAMTKLEQKNAVLAGKLAEEGIVLLDNNKNCLPFGAAIRTIALFGAGARRTIEGGTGSGHVNSRHIVSLEEGLEAEGYTIVTKAWLDEYDRVQDDALDAYEATIRELAKESSQKALLTMMGSPFAEPQFRSLTPEELADLHADAAVYVLARKSGEGADRNDAEGDYRLTEQEVHDIQLLSEHYRRFVLVLNVGGPMDLRPVRNFSGLGAILYIGQGGVECGRAAARVLSGTVTPSSCTASGSMTSKKPICPSTFLRRSLSRPASISGRTVIICRRFRSRPSRAPHLMRLSTALRLKFRPWMRFRNE